MKIGIIGGGIAGLMCAYKLASNSNYNITVFEQGANIESRYCPIVQKQTGKCLHCSDCSIMSGVAGCGAFSDGKFIIGTEYGGWLPELIGSREALNYIQQVDNILVNFGATEERYKPDNTLKQKCLEYDLHLLQCELKHLGTDANYDTMCELVRFMEKFENLTIKTHSKVVNVRRNNRENKIDIVFPNNIAESFDRVIFAVGRSGSEFLSTWCEANNITTTSNQVDIGCRVEIPSLVWEPMTKQVYEPKIMFRTKQYGDKCRSFCVNPYGEVVLERLDDIITVNGHSYQDPKKGTNNTNFAILSSINFTSPFNKPVEYVKNIARLANMVSGGSVLVQRLGDLEKGQRTTESRLAQSTVIPTLEAAVPGDLSLVLPKRILDNICETLHALDKVAPGTANYDTLLYGVEMKLCSVRPLMKKNFELKEFEGIYMLGDGAGISRGLSQAGASGLYLADRIMEENNGF